MEIFYLTVDVMLMMFLLIIAGFILQKTKILPEGSDITLARLETYILVPALNFYTWSSNCTFSTFKENSNLILWGVVVIAVAVSLGYLLCRFFVPKASLAHRNDNKAPPVPPSKYGKLSEHLSCSTP